MTSFSLALHRLPAVLEWTIAFGFTLYLLTFFYDLRMAKGVHRGDLAKDRLIDMQQHGVPIAAATQGHEGEFDPYARASYESGPNAHANAYPNGNTHSHINRQTGMSGPGRDYAYENSVRTNGTGSTMGGNGNGVSFPQPTHYAANARAANA